MWRAYKLSVKSSRWYKKQLFSIAYDFNYWRSLRFQGVKNVKSAKAGMDWIKKKKEEAKQAAAKLQNKRAAFKGEGNVLGGGADGGEAAPAAPAAERPSGSGIKARSSGVLSRGAIAAHVLTASCLDAVVREERAACADAGGAAEATRAAGSRRLWLGELQVLVLMDLLQAKALEQRTNAWEKRVDKARKARLLQGEENEARLGVPLPPPPPVSTGSNANLPPPVVLSNDEVKAREIRDAHAQMGFNPYAATFSSSSEATSAMNSIGGGSEPSPPPPAAPSATAAAFPAPGQVAEQLGALTVEESEGTGAVYVLLRQEPTRAITAAETLIKLLSNIVKNPQVRRAFELYFRPFRTKYSRRLC